jgi:hypothetical protein
MASLEGETQGGPVRRTHGVYSLLAALLLLLAAAGSSAGQSADTTPPPCERGEREPIFSEILTTDEDVTAFLVALKKAVAADDRRKVASMIRYPIDAWTGRKDVDFRTPAALLASYELIFTARLKKTIADARTECLFTNARAAMIHDGEIWINGFRTGTLEIIRINGPIGKDPKK